MLSGRRKWSERRRRGRQNEKRWSKPHALIQPEPLVDQGNESERHAGDGKQLCIASQHIGQSLREAKFAGDQPIKLNDYRDYRAE